MNLSLFDVENNGQQLPAGLAGMFGKDHLVMYIEINLKTEAHAINFQCFWNDKGLNRIILNNKNHEKIYKQNTNHLIDGHRTTLPIL